MTTAQSRVADLARWIDASSGPRNTPMGGDTEVGRYAVIVPCDFDEPPSIEGDPGCLLLFVSVDQAEGVATGPIVTDNPASQDKAAMRLCGFAISARKRGRTCRLSPSSGLMTR